MKLVFSVEEIDVFKMMMMMMMMMMSMSIFMIRQQIIFHYIMEFFGELSLCVPARYLVPSHHKSFRIANSFPFVMHVVINHPGIFIVLANFL